MRDMVSAKTHLILSKDDRAVCTIAKRLHDRVHGWQRSRAHGLRRAAALLAVTSSLS